MARFGDFKPGEVLGKNTYRETTVTHGSSVVGWDDKTIHTFIPRSNINKERGSKLYNFMVLSECVQRETFTLQNLVPLA